MLPAGQLVGDYRIEGVLGHGSMGTVYRATQLSADRSVALKMLAEQFIDEPEVQARFEREGRLQGALEHPNIVAVYETGTSDHGMYIAMPVIEGPTLKDLIRARELTPGRTVHLLAQVASALDEAHAGGLIHRDVKPQNILVASHDHVYLSDFGLSRGPDEAGLTGVAQFLGTIDYAAPEQVQSEPTSAATDGYALAAVLYECLTGEVPYPRSSEAATLFAQVAAPPPRVTDQCPDLPVALDDVIEHGMAKDPRDRPGSATELIAQAAQALS